jgi:type IV secretory pathway TraG/TraD family ATPase VirD4
MTWSDVWHARLAPPGVAPDYAKDALVITPSMLLALYAYPSLWALQRMNYHPFAQRFSDSHVFALWVSLWVAVCVIASWVLYRTVVMRVLKLLGLWDPFTFRIFRARPWLLRLYVHCTLWWELHKFGKRPTGAWASLLEVLTLAYQDGDIFLGRPALPFHLGGLMRPVGLETQKHFITIAAPGAAKTTASLIPNLLTYKGSCFSVDPAAELATICAARRGSGGQGVRGMGHKVYLLDGYNTVEGMTTSVYNPFCEMARIAQRDPDAPVAYASAMADGLVKRSDKFNPYFDDNAHTLLRGLILYVFDGPREKRTLAQVREFLIEGDEDHLQQMIRNGSASPNNTAFEALLDGMKFATGRYASAIHAAVVPLLNMGPNQFGAVLTTAQEHTAFLDYPEIKRMCVRPDGGSDFLLEDFRTQKITVFNCMPLSGLLDKPGRFMRMMIMLFVEVMLRPGPRPRIPVLLAIDEFGNLGPMEKVTVIGPYMRKYGVRLHVVLQDIAQLKMYGDNAGGFIGNAEAVQLLGVSHPETVEFVANELLPKHEVTETDPFSGQQRRVVRPMLDRDQVSKLLNKRWKYQIVIRGDAKPLLLKLTPYFKYLPARYYSPDSRFREAWNRRIYRWGSKPRYAPGGKRLKSETWKAFDAWLVQMRASAYEVLRREASALFRKGREFWKRRSSKTSPPSVAKKYRVEKI